MKVTAHEYRFLPGYLKQYVDMVRDDRMSRDEKLDAALATEIERTHAPYPWCNGDPTVADCVARGWCAKDPNCGE